MKPSKRAEGEQLEPKQLGLVKQASFQNMRERMLPLHSSDGNATSQPNGCFLRLLLLTLHCGLSDAEEFV